MRNNYEVVYYRYQFNNETSKKDLAIIGRMIINDDNTSWDFPLAAKAFNHAPYDCRSADKIVFHKVKL